MVLDPFAGRLAGVYMLKLCNFFDKHFPATEFAYIQLENGRLKLRVRVERSERTESIVLKKQYGLTHF